jgi:sterol desaturase/sphingolipid hydroxylase (fatty acid hydroxylase superfamily)
MALLELTQEVQDAADANWLSQTPASFNRKDRPTSVRVFKNGFVENVFGKAHWFTPIVWFGAPISYGIYRGLTDARVGAVLAAGLFVLGVLQWTLLEYVLHRFVFHWQPKQQKDQIKAFLIHGYHHVYHQDKMRLVAPPVMSWGPAIAIAALYYLAFGRVYCATVFAGTCAGYVAYDWIHYYTHHARPTTALGKWLRRYHMIHHFKEHDACFGVSTPLWDVVFGTYRPPRTATQTAASEERAA